MTPGTAGTDPVPAEAVEAAAKSEAALVGAPWDEISDDGRESFRRAVRPMLAAAAPLIAAGLGRQVEELAIEVVRFENERDEALAQVERLQAHAAETKVLLETAAALRRAGGGISGGER